jgi:hypothetical protein
MALFQRTAQVTWQKYLRRWAATPQRTTLVSAPHRCRSALARQRPWLGVIETRIACVRSRQQACLSRIKHAAEHPALSTTWFVRQDSGGDFSDDFSHAPQTAEVNSAYASQEHYKQRLARPPADDEFTLGEELANAAVEAGVEHVASDHFVHATVGMVEYAVE